MGLFSSKKKTTVNTTVQAIFRPEDIPKFTKTGVIKAVISDTDVVENVLEEAISSIGIKADIGYRWAKENYSYGLPTSDTRSVVTARQVVLNQLSVNEGGKVREDYYRFGPPNSIHYGWQILQDRYGYNPQTNEITGLTAQVGVPVYLTDMVATYQRSTLDYALERADVGIFEQWGPAPSSGYTPKNPFNTLLSFGQFAAQSVYEVDDTATQEYLTIKYQYEVEKKNAEGVIYKEIEYQSMKVIMDDIDETLDYHQVRYVNVSGQVKFFTYRDGAGLYPAIDNVYSMDFDSLGTYYPWCYIRYNDQNMASKDKKDTRAYKDSVKWCKKLGIDFAMLSEGIHADPNVDDVEQAILLFGVPAGATDQSELEYLFEYFSLLHTATGGATDVADTLAGSLAKYTKSPSYVQTIQDKAFRMSFAHAGISRRRVAGKIGKVGTFTGTLGKETIKQSYWATGREGGRLETTESALSYYSYCCQTHDSMYEEVRVYNPTLTNYISGKHSHVASAGQPELLIPVDRAVTASMSLRAREQLLSRSLHLNVNTKIVTKTKWYQSSWFKVVMIIIVIVVTIVTWGSGTYAALAAAAEIGVGALAFAVLAIIVKAIVVNVALKMFVKAVGPEIGIVVAVLAIAVGGYYGFTGELGSSTATWGQNLLSVGNNLVTVSQEAYEALLTDLNKELMDFNNFAKGEWDNLADKKEMLGLSTNNVITGLEFISQEPAVIFGETPTDFYNRTVHSGNIGTLCYAGVSSYVDTALTLPTLNQSEGDTYDGFV